MAVKMHTMPEDVCWVAECDEPVDVANAIKQMFDIGLTIRDVSPYLPNPANGASSQGHRFIVIGIPQRLLS